MKKRNLYFNHDVLVVAIHNKREEMLVKCINNYISQVKDYYNNNSFGDKTYNTCWRITEEINTLFSALYYLDCIKSPFKVVLDDIV